MASLPAKRAKLQDDLLPAPPPLVAAEGWRDDSDVLVVVSAFTRPFKGDWAWLDAEIDLLRKMDAAVASEVRKDCHVRCERMHRLRGHPRPSLRPLTGAFPGRLSWPTPKASRSSWRRRVPLNGTTMTCDGLPTLPRPA